MSELDYEQRLDAGVRELCDLAGKMEPEEAEGFFQAIAYAASNRHRRLLRESAEFSARRSWERRQESQ
jgi:hypothetical protein